MKIRKFLEDKKFTKSARFKLTEMALNNSSEVVKLYSSVYRVHNYAMIEPPKFGKARMIESFSQIASPNPFTPKISRQVYDSIRADKRLWNEYKRQVLMNDIVEGSIELFKDTNPDYKHKGRIKNTYLRVLHNIESSWLFHRSYHKIFSEYHTNLKIFLELNAYLGTHSNQFFMREFLNYLEGNYVISLRGTGKVYIPHLQAALDSVELPYTSLYGIGNFEVIVDYLEKSRFTNTNELLKYFDEMIAFETDVISGKGKIFLKCSKYVNEAVYLKMYRDWLKEIGNNLLPLHSFSRQEIKAIIRKLIRQKKIKLPQNLFRRHSQELEYIENYDYDYDIFFVRKSSAISRLLLTLFVALIEYSINRHRMESQHGVNTESERTEYETVFRRYREMTLLERRMNCLLVEDGEISLVLLLSKYLSEPESLNKIEILLSWGLIEQVSVSSKNKFKFTPRAQRMAKWYAKLAALNLSFTGYGKRNDLKYANNRQLRLHYDSLSFEQDTLFHWMRCVKDRQTLTNLLSEFAFSKNINLTSEEMIKKFLDLCCLCTEGQTPLHKAEVDLCVRQKSRFNHKLNEFLRTNETINRSVVSFPISTIPTELPGLKEKIYGFSIFIGTFHLSDGLDDDVNFSEEIYELERILHAAKVYFTLIGKPASEVLNRFVVSEEASASRVSNTLGKFAHSLKNEGVSLRAQIDILKETVKKESTSEVVKVKVDDLEKFFERFNGAIQLLNMTSNPFQAKYLAKRPYCLLDVILQAYCNALDQFLVAGPILELKNMRLPGGNYFKSPVLRVTVENQFDHQQDFASKQLQYFPDLPNVFFLHPTTPKLDGDAVLTADQIFRDTLPDWNMMLSAYLEIFNNVLQYCRKDVEELYVDIKLKRNIKEIVVEIANEAVAENLQRLSAFSLEDHEYARGRGAGVDTNILFFKNIGGDFRLISDFGNTRALAISRINLEFLKRFR